MKSILKYLISNERICNIKKFLRGEGKRLCKEEKGYYLAFYALTFIVFFIMLASIVNIGVVVGEKMRIQYAADEASYSEAVVAARMYNFLAYTNRAILANYSTISFITALQSSGMAYDALALFFDPFFGAGEVFRPAATVYNSLFTATSWLRPVARALSYASIAYQTAALTEEVTNLSQSKIAKEIAKEIDPKIKINEIAKSEITSYNAVSFMRVFGFMPPIKGGAQGLFKKMAKFIEKSGKPGKFLASLVEEMADNSSFEELVYQSTDGFARGTSLPRSFKLDLGFVKFLIGGDLKVNEDYIDQQDLGFSVIIFGVRFRLGLVHAYDKNIDLSFMGFYNYTDVPEYTQDAGATFYTVASKDKTDIFQISPFGFKMGLKNDIVAISKSQTFYFDPDQKRSDSLAKAMSGPNMKVFDMMQNGVFGGPREPNLFNPFWHASLKDLNLIPPEEEKKGPLQDNFKKLDENFGIQEKIRKSIQYKMFNSILEEMVNGKSDSSLIVH